MYKDQRTVLKKWGREKGNKNERTLNMCPVSLYNNICPLQTECSTLPTSGWLSTEPNKI